MRRYGGVKDNATCLVEKGNSFGIKYGQCMGRFTRHRRGGSWQTSKHDDYNTFKQIEPKFMRCGLCGYYCVRIEKRNETYHFYAVCISHSPYQCDIFIADPGAPPVNFTNQCQTLLDTWIGESAAHQTAIGNWAANSTDHGLILYRKTTFITLGDHPVTTSFDRGAILIPGTTDYNRYRVAAQTYKKRILKVKVETESDKRLGGKYDASEDPPAKTGRHEHKSGQKLFLTSKVHVVPVPVPAVGPPPDDDDHDDGDYVDLPLPDVEPEAAGDGIEHKTEPIHEQPVEEKMGELSDDAKFDRVIEALRNRYNKRNLMDGFESPYKYQNVLQNEERGPILDRKLPSAQMLHEIGYDHWVLALHYGGQIYSINTGHGKLLSQTRGVIRRWLYKMKPKEKIREIRVPKQKGGIVCGYLALAYAVAFGELIKAKDPNPIDKLKHYKYRQEEICTWYQRMADAGQYIGPPPFSASN